MMEDRSGDTVPAQRLGAFVKARRQAVGLTQEELAKKVNLSQWHISNMERGRAVMMPTPELFLDLADALHAEPEEILEFIGYLRAEKGAEARPMTAAAVFARLSHELQQADNIPDDARDVIQRAIDYARQVANLDLEGTGVRG